MRRTKAVEAREVHEHEILKQLYELLPVNKPEEGVSVNKLAEALGTTSSKMGHAKRVFEDAGILRTTITYVGGHGRSATWMLRVPYEHAVDRLAKHHTNKAQLTIAKSPAEETRAIIGPEPESPFAPLRGLIRNDDAEALVEAARQYADRSRVIEEHLAAIESAGITVDRDRVNESIGFVRDERLQAVSDVLPVIDRYMEAIERTKDVIAEIRPRLKRIEALETENRRQKEQIERLVAKNGATPP